MTICISKKYVYIYIYIYRQAGIPTCPSSVRAPVLGFLCPRECGIGAMNDSKRRKV